MSQASWWAAKVRQFRSHLGARVTAAERDGLASWLRPAERRLFDSMHPADRRHGLDVVGSLRVAGVTDREVLVAGLLHDAGKGRTGLWPRVAWSLGEAYGSWIWRIVAAVPGFREPLGRLARHAELSAALAADAGCSARTVDLIRAAGGPADGHDRHAALLRLADEAN